MFGSFGSISTDVSIAFNAEACKIGQPAFDETVAALKTLPGVANTQIIVNMVPNSACCNIIVRKKQRSCIPDIAQEARKLKYVANVWAAEV